jgi:hypothetical protein
MRPELAKRVATAAVLQSLCEVAVRIGGGHGQERRLEWHCVHFVTPAGMHRLPFQRDDAPLSPRVDGAWGLAGRHPPLQPDDAMGAGCLATSK